MSKRFSFHPLSLLAANLQVAVVDAFNKVSVSNGKGRVPHQAQDRLQQALPIRSYRNNSYVRTGARGK